MTLPELAIKRHVTTLMLIMSIVVLGVVAITRLPLAFLPDIEEPELFVQLPYSNASPEQVERMVVRPVEDVLGSVGGLKSIWSRCDEDGGRIRMDFDWSADLQLARVEIWEKLDRVRRDLPEDMGDIMVSSSWNARETDQPILEGRLSSELDLSQSYDLLERKIVKPLERIRGVAQVNLDGVNPREVRINLRIEDLELHGIDVRSVSERIRASNFDQSLGRIVEGDRQWTLRTVGAFRDVDEIRDLQVREDGLRLADIADVLYEEPPLEYGRHLDGDFAVGITVSAESKANVVQVCDELKDRIAAMDDDPELQGVNFLVWFNQGKEIRSTLRDLAFTGIFGAVLASIVLFLFLRRVSTTIVSVMCIPFSLIVTCGVIWAQGKNLNTISLLGLIVGIGMLVDNAVVVIENIFRHQEMGENQKDAARNGSREVSTAVMAATLTSVIVFLPLIFNKPSEMNIYLKELGLTVAITLLASLFISQTLIPLATSWFIRSKPKGKGRWMTWMEDRYVSVLDFNLRRRWLTPIIGLTVIASTFFPFTNIDFNFDSSEAELFAQIGYHYSEESTLEQKRDMIIRIENLLDPHREELMARSIYSWWSDRFSITRVYLHEGESSPENLAKVRGKLKELLPEIPGLRLEVMQNRRFWRQDRGKRVAFQLVGEDSETLTELAEDARTRLESIPGLINPFSGDQQGRQEMHVELDRELAAQYGVSPQQLAQVVGLTFRGQRLRRFRTPDGEREMRLTLDERETESTAQLANLPLWRADGERVPVAAIADLNEVPGAAEIQRDDRLTSIWVGAEYEEGTRDQYMEQVRASLNAMEFPYGYSWTFGRWQSRQQEKSQEFLVNLLLALGLIFAVMSGLFESVRQAIGLMIALPFAIAGAAWTLYLTGTDLDQPAAVGVLLLIGIVVNNGIVMIEHINQYRRDGMDRHEAMLRGGRERLRPILMTAVTTLIGLLPIVVQKPSLGGTYYYSMAYVIMGGLALSTFLTTTLLPTTTTLVEDILGWVGGSLRRVVRRAS